MTSKPRFLMIGLGWFFMGVIGCSPAIAPTPAKLDNSRCKVTSLTVSEIPVSGDTITLKAGSQAAFEVVGETVGLYSFHSKKLRAVKPPAGSKAGARTRYLMMDTYAWLVRAGSEGEDIEESFCHGGESVDSTADCNERSWSWKHKIQVPTRPGIYEFRITAYWFFEHDEESGLPVFVEPGVPYTPKSHVLGTWKAIVE